MCDGTVSRILSGGELSEDASPSGSDQAVSVSGGEGVSVFAGQRRTRRVTFTCNKCGEGGGGGGTMSGLLSD